MKTHFDNDFAAGALSVIKIDHAETTAIVTEASNFSIFVKKFALKNDDL